MQLNSTIRHPPEQNVVPTAIFHLLEMLSLEALLLEYYIANLRCPVRALTLHNPRLVCPFSMAENVWSWSLVSLGLPEANYSVHDFALKCYLYHVGVSMSSNSAYEALALGVSGY